MRRFTGGNPFFVTEILASGPDGRWKTARYLAGFARRSLGPGGPADGARTPSRARRGDLRATCQYVGAGDRMCPGAAAALAECLDAGLLHADGAALAFRHELARGGPVGLDDPPIGNRVHARALAALARAPVPPETLAVAFTPNRPTTRRRRPASGSAAAERAAAVGAHREAAELYALALRHADRTPKQQKVLWLEGHAFESYLSGRAEAAARSWREAVVLRRDRATGSVRATICAGSHTCLSAGPFHRGRPPLRKHPCGCWKD